MSRAPWNNVLHPAAGAAVLPLVTASAAAGHRRLQQGGNQMPNQENLQLKLKSPKDRKRYNTDVANTEQLLRVIQSIP